MSAAQPRPAPLPQTYTFGEIEPGHYQLTIMPLGIQFDIDRLRRERGELKGELCVRCDFAKRSLEGVISIGPHLRLLELFYTFRLAGPTRSRTSAHQSAKVCAWTRMSCF